MFRIRNALLLFVAALVLAGCISSRAPVKISYYSLPAGENNELTSTVPAVMVGPVELPQYLDRFQIVIRGADGRIVLREQDRWAEPLERAATGRLASGLRNVLQSEGVVPFPVTGYTEYDYRVSVKVSRFEATTDDTVVLEGVWSVSNNEGDLLGALRFASYERSASTRDSAAVIAAMAAMLDDLAIDVAARITELEAGR